MLSTTTTRVYEAFTLTNAYTTPTAPEYVEIPNNEGISIDYSYTTGASETGTSLDIKVQFANPLGEEPATADFVDDNVITVGTPSVLSVSEFRRSGGAGATTYTGQIRFDAVARFARVYVKENGVSSNAGTLNFLRLNVKTLAE